MFAAVFNLRAEPIDVQRLGVQRLGVAGDCSVETFGGGRRAVFVHSNAGSYGVQGEPCMAASLGGRYWIVGRVRLNARRELQARLAVGEGAAPLSDAELCLHAYAAWGERFVEFLSGDYAFVLWDNARQRLLGVRDQLGTRALFHARIGDAWFVSDTLDWIIQQPSVSQELDDYWIADLLTLGFCREFERTVYRAVQRLAPAHVLRLDEAGPHIRRYWRLEIVEPVYFRDRATYTERFRDLLSQAIADRMPPGKVGISMSGGLDSTTLAACAVSVAGSSASRVVGDSIYSEELAHLREDYFASLAARHLGIKLRLRRWDVADHDADWRSHGIRPAEPSVTMFDARYRSRMFSEQACEASVWFDGEGPDNALMFERNAYLSWLLGRRAWGRLGGALFEYARVKGLKGWAQTARRHAGPRPDDQPAAPLPLWLNRDFADRTQLVERARTLGEGGDTSHPWHPNAVASFTSPIWQSHFADFDFDETLGPVVWRHPYLDVRVIEYLLAVPPVPWAWKKQLVREAMRGRMPDELLRREKTPVPQEDVVPLLSRLRCTPEFMANGRLEKYVDVKQISTESVLGFMTWPALSVFALDHWLTLS